MRTVEFHPYPSFSGGPKSSREDEEASLFEKCWEGVLRREQRFVYCFV